MSATQTDKVYDYLADIARRGAPMPRDYEIAVAAGCAIGGAAMCMTILRRTNRVTIESEGSGTSSRRRAFVAGFWTGWTHKKAATDKYDPDMLPKILPAHDKRMKGVRFEDVKLRRHLVPPRYFHREIFSGAPSSLGFAAT